MQEERKLLLPPGFPSFHGVNYNQVDRHIYRRILSIAGSNEARASQSGSQQQDTAYPREFREGFIQGLFMKVHVWCWKATGVRQ